MKQSWQPTKKISLPGPAYGRRICFHRRNRSKASSRTQKVLRNHSGGIAVNIELFAVGQNGLKPVGGASPRPVAITSGSKLKPDITCGFSVDSMNKAGSS